MSIKYNADEIFEMALEIERNGASFYRRAAESGQSEQARAMLLELAAMEEDHEKTFAEMREELTDDERKETTYDPQGELPLYLQAMADKQIFKKGLKPAMKLTGKETVEDFLRFALSMEKESILFYLGLQDLVPSRLGSDRINHIIREEMNHIAVISDLLKCARG